jgi:curved DNA-binding protein CbpA
MSAADYYQLLGVPRSATSVEIRQAYLRLAREKHPDRFADPQEKERAQSVFKDLTTAFNTLSNDDRRREYDAESFRPAPRTAPEIAKDAFEKAGPCLERGELPDAIQHLRTAVHHAPQEARYHAGLGRALGRSPAHLREAIQVLEKAVQMDPGLAAAWTDLAQLFLTQGLRIRAQKAAEAALRLAPRDARVQRLAVELGVGRTGGA